MAQTIVIQKGDELLQDVELKTPDTKVNLCSDEKYPTNFIFKGGTNQKTFVDPDDTEFVSPHPARQPASDEGETGETETGETESGESL